MIDWWRPVAIVVGLELRQRTRATRWRVTVLVAFLFMSAVVFGTRYLAANSYDSWRQDLYAIVLLVLLFLGLVVSPGVVATSINADRKDATLAVVQATPIGAAQLAVGKMLSGWVAAMALFVVSTPYLWWGIAIAPFDVATSLLGIVVASLLVLCYCGIALGFSALTARPVSSIVLTQVAVFFLAFGLPLTAAVLTPMTRESIQAVRPDFDWNEKTFVSSCRNVVRTVEVEHSERIWWLLAANPLVVVADAAAQSEHRPAESLNSDNLYTSVSMLRDIAESVSRMRAGPDPHQDRTCGDRGDSGWGEERTDAHRFVGYTWYLGLAVNLALGAAGLALAIRRLRVPAQTLPRGVRIA